MNTVCTCGVKFRDAEDWRDHMPCPGTELERVREELEELRFTAGEVGNQNALLEMENARLRQEIQKLNGYLMERSVGSYDDQPCTTCGAFVCDGAPRFKGICPESYTAKKLRAGI